MRKSLAVVSMCVILYTGCVSVPKWVMEPPQDEELIFGLGVSSQMTSEALSWEEAENHARQDLSFQISFAVKGMQTAYADITGTSQSTDFFENVNKQLSSVVMEGARIVKRGVGSKHKYYVLASYRKSAMKQAVESYTREEANRNPTFQREAVIKNMDAELEKLVSDTVEVQNTVNTKQQAEWQKWKTELEQEHQRLAAQQRQQTERLARLEQEIQRLRAAQQVSLEPPPKTDNDSRNHSDSGNNPYSRNDYAFRNHLDFISGYVQWGDGLVGGGGSLFVAGIHWSPIPFIAIGLESRLGGLGETDKSGDFMGGIAPTLGLVFPFNKHIKLFGDGLLEIGSFGGLSGLLSGSVTPGFDAGINLWWDEDFPMGFDIKYRGTWYENHYTHAISISLLMEVGSAL